MVMVRFPVAGSTESFSVALAIGLRLLFLRRELRREQMTEGGPVEHLLLDQQIAQRGHDGPLLGKDGLGALALRLEDAENRVLEGLQRGLRRGSLVAAALDRRVATHARRVAAHAQLLDEDPRERRGALEIVARSEREIVEQE